MIYGARDDRD